MVSPVFSLVLALPVTPYTSRIPELCFLHVSPVVCGEGVGVCDHGVDYQWPKEWVDGVAWYLFTVPVVVEECHQDCGIGLLW